MRRGHWLAACLAGVACQAHTPADFSLPKSTSDRMVGFVRLYVDPDRLDEHLVGESASRGDLMVGNPFATWVDVSVAEEPLGRLAPWAVAWVYDVPVGQWEVRYEPSGAPAITRLVMVAP